MGAAAPRAGAPVDRRRGVKLPEYYFVDFALAGVEARNNVVDIREVAAMIRGEERPAFCTVCRFPVVYREHVQRFGSVKGYPGAAYADYLTLDIDREGDLAAAQCDAVRIAEHIQAAFGIEPNGVRYFFSGAKGFHECIPALLMDARPAVDVPRRLKAVAFAIAGAAGVEIDRAIYDVNRLLRVPNTRHPKSNLWKVELAWEELLGLSVDEIR